MASLITSSHPGDLFIVKNVGNVVPPHDASSGSHSVGAAIEYAVGSLGVRQVVICGHSRCGAMHAMLGDALDADQSPHLAAWLELLRPVRHAVEQDTARSSTDAETRALVAAEWNVRIGLDNLRRYPCVAARLEKGDLQLHGWVFHIDDASVTRWDPQQQSFAALPLT